MKKSKHGVVLEKKRVANRPEFSECPTILDTSNTCPKLPDYKRSGKSHPGLIHKLRNLEITKQDIKPRHDIKLPESSYSKVFDPYQQDSGPTDDSKLPPSEEEVILPGHPDFVPCRITYKPTVDANCDILPESLNVLKNDKVVCFGGIKRDAFKFRHMVHWYALDIGFSKMDLPIDETEGAYKDAAVQVFPFSKKQIFILSSSLAVGTTLYVLGGRPFDKRFSSDVLVYDIDSSLGEWVKGPRMICPRRNPISWAVDGKLFVLGGIEQDSCGPYLEFLENCTWKAAKPFPYQKDHFDWFIDLSAFLDWRGEILMGSVHNSGPYSPFMKYVVSSDSWETFDDTEFRERAHLCCGQALVVNRTLFWFKKDLQVFFFDEKKWSSVPIIGLQKFGTGSKHFEPCLFHLEDDLFLLMWLDACVKPNPPRRYMHCTKFRISKSAECPCSLSAKVDCSRAYLIDHALIINRGFMIDRRVSDDKATSSERKSIEVQHHKKAKKASRKGKAKKV